MTAKTNQKLKREKKLEKRAKIDRATNFFMINLAWGLLGIIVIFGLRDKVSHDPSALFVPAILFSILGGAFFICGAFNLLKGKTRFYNYGIFSVAVAIMGFYLTYFGPVRKIVTDVFTSLEYVSSAWWTTWGPALVVAVYLVVVFTWTVVSISKIEKGK